jgi:hypothetical protein
VLPKEVTWQETRSEEGTKEMEWMMYRQSERLCTRWGEIAQSFTRVTANLTNCCGFYIVGYPLKAHNSSLDLQWLL